MAWKIRKPLFDGLLIVFSVLFALFITSSYENFQTRKKTRIALESIESEFERNLGILHKWKENHSEIRDKVSSVAYGQNDSLANLFMNFDFFNFGILTNNEAFVNELLTTTAWETAKATGIIGEFDFETAQKLTMAYDMKRIITDSSLKNILNFYYSKEAHDMKDFKGTMMQFSLRLYEITIQEETAIIIVSEAIEHLKALKK